MDSSSKIHYKGWEIVPLAVPTTDGKWSASCDIERATAEGLEVFEGSTMQFVRDDEDGAIAAACEEAVRQIDNIIANPLVRLAYRRPPAVFLCARAAFHLMAARAVSCFNVSNGMIETYLKRRWNIADLNRDIAVPWRDSACSAAARLFSLVFTAPWRIFRADARCWHGEHMTQYSAGAAFRKAVQEESPLQVVGAINANHALLAKRAGYKAIYLSGGGVAAGSLGLPDLGISSLDDVLTDIRRITDVCDLPLLVDADTGFGASAFNVARTVKSMIKFGAAGLHIEDQVGAKRCGHRPGKEIVSKEEMVDRIKAAVDARTDPNFVIMARTDALAVDGLEAALERAVACVEAGADMIFPEAITDLDMYATFAKAVNVPILANITEFGSTPLFTLDELRSAHVGLALYPLSAFRAMNKAAENVYQALRHDGTQKNVVDTMQTRMELYESINYHDFEQKLDALFAAQKK
eukprot:gene18267-21860_t